MLPGQTRHVRGAIDETRASVIILAAKQKLQAALSAAAAGSGQEPTKLDLPAMAVELMALAQALGFRSAEDQSKLAGQALSEAVASLGADQNGAIVLAAFIGFFEEQRKSGPRMIGG